MPVSRGGVMLMKDVLQWQEGTDEPEDEPNISNGVDVIPREFQTQQPRQYYGKPSAKNQVRQWMMMQEM